VTNDCAISSANAVTGYAKFLASYGGNEGALLDAAEQYLDASPTNVLAASAPANPSMPTAHG
jgi:hypothetical protein